MLKKSASFVLASLRGSTYRSVRLASSLAAALLNGLFEYPAKVFFCCATCVDHLRSGVSIGWNLCFQQTGAGANSDYRHPSRIFQFSISLCLSLGEWPRLPFTARIERPLLHRGGSASKKGTWPPRALLLALNRHVHDVSLPIDQQECKIGRFQRVGETLEGCEIVDRLTIEFEHDVARLETGGFC
jgi:hypothetical protein